MSFRIWATNFKHEADRPKDGKSHQVYGNNDFPTEVRDYLVKKGAKLDEDDCFYDFEIKDVQEFLDAMLAAHNGYVENDSYWDFKPTREIKTPYDLISHCEYKVALSYVFIVYNFYEAFEDVIELVWDDEKKAEKYQLKKGATLYLSGF